jgi:hypothetical protein
MHGRYRDRGTRATPTSADPHHSLSDDELDPEPADVDELLSHLFRDDNEADHEIYEGDAAPAAAHDVDDDDKPRRVYRRAKRPEFLRIPHRALRDPRLNECAAALFTVQVYLERKGGRVTLARIAKWLGYARPTVSEHATKLRRLGLFDADNRPTADALDKFHPALSAAGDPLPLVSAAAELRVDFDAVERLGLKDAVAAAMVRDTQRFPRVKRLGRFVALSARFIGRLLGVAWATARKRLRRLKDVDEVELRTEGRTGCAPLVRPVSDHERKARAAAAKAAAAKAAEQPQVKRPSTPANYYKLPQDQVDENRRIADEILARVKGGPPPATAAPG